MITKSEYFRKLIHLFNLVIPLSYFFIFPDKWNFLNILILLTICFITIDICRNIFPAVQSIFSIFFDKMLRDHELNGKFTGATWVMIASCISVLLFSKPVAILALIFMSLGDTAAGLIGQQYGKNKIGDKTWEGFFAGLFVCLIISINYNLLPLYVSISGAFTAMIMEILPIPLDDNFKIPLGAGGIMMMLLSPI
jgi:glycerol-3-phosphate acyltransferase PlsY